MRSATAHLANVAFGPEGEKTIYVVGDEHGSLSSIDVDVDGLPLFWPHPLRATLASGGLSLGTFVMEFATAACPGSPRGPGSTS